MKLLNNKTGKALITTVLLLISIFLAIQFSMVYAANPTLSENVSSCWAEDNAAKGAFNAACGNMANLTKNDGAVESHTYIKQGPTNYWGVLEFSLLIQA